MKSQLEEIAPGRVSPADFGPNAAPGGGRPAPVVLVGNPNVGKSVIFGHLTRSYATVSNYPGTTIELTRAPGSEIAGTPEVIDTPGTNSLTPLSEDERVTRDVLLDTPDARVLQVADAKNLRRALLVAIELAELEIPFSLILNMWDESRAREIEIDTRRLAKALGVSVVTTVATRREGLDAAIRSVGEARASSFSLALPEELAAAHAQTVALLPSAMRGRRGIAAMLLAGDPDLARRLAPEIGAEAVRRIEAIRRTLTRGTAETIAGRFTRARLRAADAILAQCYTTGRAQHRAGAALGRITTHPVWGVPFLLAVLYATYQIVGVFGAGTAVDFLENTVFARYVNPFAIGAAALLPWAFARDLLVGEFGIVTMALTYSVAIVLPIVFFFFVVFGILEDSGYLPRLAVMLNRAMRLIGLNGKAVLPMVLGLGCDTMATMTTRILETKKEKTLTTFLLALGVPCSAQLGVVLALTSQLSIWVTAIWGSVVLATLFCVGWIAARVLPGDSSDFIIELPPLRVPTLGNILQKTLARLEWYLKEAVPLFVLGTVLLFVMARTGALAFLERAASPIVVNVLSLPPQTAGAFVAGFLRRDFGAVFLGDAARAGELSPLQILVAVVVLTLFVPCVANYFIMIKERGFKSATAMIAFIFPFAVVVGGLLNWGLRALKVTL
ncbi:MAG: ferrous iron transport protein B [bacterium]